MGKTEKLHIDRYGGILNLPEVTPDSTWTEHIPFAYFLISVIRPRIFVELGVYKGSSFIAFCQAVKEMNLDSMCYGVDTWRGDEHSNFYSEAMYEELLKYQRREFGFASLLKMTFDEALDKFQDGTVDLLHIDGYHTYEAVKHDFESWLPKMSGRGVVIFHDTEVRERNFGVYKLFEEISSVYPSFNFKHGYGLGVAAVGKDVDGEFLNFIREANGNGFYQGLFSRLGRFITLSSRASALESDVVERDARVSALESGIAERDARASALESGIAERDARISALEAGIAERDARISALEARIGAADAALQGIYGSHGWKFLLLYYRLRDKFLPADSIARRLAKTFFKAVLRSLFFFKETVLRVRQSVSFSSIEGRMSEWLSCRIDSIENSLPSPQFVFRKARRPEEFGVNRLLCRYDDLPRVDVVIVTYNSENSIEDCIRSINSSDYDITKIKIIIVDNDSTDRTVEVLDKCVSIHKNVEVIRNRNTGFGRGVNSGFRHATAGYLFILNPDAMVEKDSLRYLAGAARMTEGKGFAAWEARQRPFEHPKLYDPVTLETEWMSGACFLISREAFARAGGFDPNIFLYCEDVDLSWRLRMMGGKLMYVPWANVIHNTYEDPNAIKPAQFYYSVASNGVLKHKFGGSADVKLFYAMFARLFLNPPPLERARYKMAAIGLRYVPGFIGGLLWKRRHRDEVRSFKPVFEGWDFGMARRGAFYEIKPSAGKPLVSIVIRTKDRPAFLREALQSVRNQTYQNIEVVVVEDRGISAKKVVDEFKDLNIRYFPMEGTGGRCRAGNIALSHAGGKYINFLDDDDLFYSDHVEALVGELENSRIFSAAYSIGFEVETEIIGKEPLSYKEMTYKTRYARPYSKKEIVAQNYIPINCIMFNRELYLKEGGFDESLDVLEDWDLWIRYSKHTDMLFIEKTTCLYRVPSHPELAVERMNAMGAAYDRVRNKHAGMLKSFEESQTATV